MSIFNFWKKGKGKRKMKWYKIKESFGRHKKKRVVNNLIKKMNNTMKKR